MGTSELKGQGNKLSRSTTVSGMRQSEVNKCKEAKCQCCNSGYYNSSHYKSSSPSSFPMTPTPSWKGSSPPQSPGTSVPVAAQPPPCCPCSPPLAQGLDEAGVALGSSQVQKAHAPEGASVGQTFRTPPGGAWDHALYQDHHPCLEPRPLAFILQYTHPDAES